MELKRCPFCGHKPIKCACQEGFDTKVVDGARCDNGGCMLYGYHWPADKWNNRSLEERKK